MRYVSSSLSVFCAAVSGLYPDPNTGPLVNRDLLGSEKGHGTYGKPITTGNPYDNSTAKINNISFTAHTKIKSGISLPCTNSNQTQSNATCTSIAQEEEISPEHLYNLNVAGKSPSRSRTSSSSATNCTLAEQAAPSPTQPGTSPLCNKYSQAHKGIQCEHFANASGITFENLYSWNAVLGPTGESCETHFLTNYYYCIGTTSNTTLAAVKVLTNGSVSAAPEPTQNGISPFCTQYSQAPQGDTCATLNIAKDSGISKQQFYTWNGMLESRDRLVMPTIGRSIGIAWASILLLSAESRAVPPAILIPAPCLSLSAILCLPLLLHRKAQAGIDPSFKAGDWCGRFGKEKKIVSSVASTDCGRG